MSNKINLSELMKDSNMDKMVKDFVEMMNKRDEELAKFTEKRQDEVAKEVFKIVKEREVLYDENIHYCDDVKIDPSDLYMLTENIMRFASQEDFIDDESEYFPTSKTTLSYNGDNYTLIKMSGQGTSMTIVLDKENKAMFDYKDMK